MPKLLVSLSDGSTVVHELAEASISVGRLADNALQIEDASVSSQHAELTLTVAEAAQNANVLILMVAVIFG